MLIDQDTKVDGVWVPFFGRPAFTPVGAAEIALEEVGEVAPVLDEKRLVEPELLLQRDGGLRPDLGVVA